MIPIADSDSPANQGSTREGWALVPGTPDAHHAYDDQLFPVWRMVRGLSQKSCSWHKGLPRDTLPSRQHCELKVAPHLLP